MMINGNLKNMLYKNDEKNKEAERQSCMRPACMKKKEKCPVGMRPACKRS